MTVGNTVDEQSEIIYKAKSNPVVLVNEVIFESDFGAPLRNKRVEVKSSEPVSNSPR